MRARSLGLAFAALLVLGRPVPGHAQDAAAKPAATPSTAQGPTGSPTDAPASVPRPRHRRYARHHDKRYAQWQPFPVYWPHLHRHRVYWSRVPWFSFF